MNNYTRSPLPSEEKLKAEFSIDSAIHPDLTALNCQIEKDIELDEGNEPTTPLADLLGYRQTRFTQESRSQIGVSLWDYRGQLYQVKIYTDLVKPGQKQGQYRASKGCGDIPYLAAVPQWLADKIAAKHGLEPPRASEFWQWIQNNPSIPLIITEGVKKALAGLSAGEVTVSLFGCSCGVDKATGKVKEVLLPYIEERKRVYIAFDSDSKESAIKAVKQGLARLCPALKRSDVKNVYIVKWNPEQGKGLDDLLKNNPNGLQNALEQAKKYSAYEYWKESKSLAQFNPVTIHERYFPVNYPFPKSAKIVCLKGRKKTGKTYALEQLVKEAQERGQACFVVTHRIKLAQALCKRYGLYHLEDIKELKDSRGKILGYGLCIDSLRPNSQAQFSPSEFENALVIFDEVDEVLSHLFLSKTLDKKGNRIEVFKTLEKAIKKCLSSEHGKLFLMSADLSPREINFFKNLAGNNPEVFVLENTFKPIQGKRKAYIYKSEADISIQIEKFIARGEKVLVHLSSQENKYNWSTSTTYAKLTKRFPHQKILVIDSHTVSDKNHPAFNCMDRLDELLAQYDIVLASPTIETGVSIDLKNHFKNVLAIAGGTQSVNAAAQTTERLRDDVDRHIYVTQYSPNRIGNGATYSQGLMDWVTKLTRFNEQSLNDVLAASSPLITSCGLLFVETWTEYASQYNFGNKNYDEIFLGLLQDEGYELIEVEEAAKNEIDNQIIFSKAVKDELYIKHCNEVATTANPDDKKYNKLDNQQNKTKDERQTYKKGSICRAYQTIDVKPQLVADHEDGLYGKLEAFYSLFEGREFLDYREVDRFNRTLHNGLSFAPDTINALQKSKIATLEKILKPIITNDKGEIDTKTIFTKETLKDWFDNTINPFRKDIKDYAGLTIGTNTKIDNIIPSFRNLLELIGLDLVRLKSRDGQIRQYQINQQNLFKYKDILERWFERDCSKYRTSQEFKKVTSSVQFVTLEPYINTTPLQLSQNVQSSIQNTFKEQTNSTTNLEVGGCVGNICISESVTVSDTVVDNLMDNTNRTATLPQLEKVFSDNGQELITARNDTTNLTTLEDSKQQDSTNEVEDILTKLDNTNRAATLPLREEIADPWL